MTLKKHLLYPLLLLLLIIVVEYTGLDVWLESFFYNAELKQWPWKDRWLTSEVLHTGARRAVVGIVLLVILSIALSYFIERLKPYRKAAAYFCIASLSGPLIVGIGKNLIHIYSPWDLVMFGGSKPYIRILDAVPEGAAVGHAFPAGHASAGFAFISLYFLLREYRPKYRFYGLAFGLLLGFLFGFTQQSRGAHFLSHDLMSLLISWYAALIVYYLMYVRQK